MRVFAWSSLAVVLLAGLLPAAEPTAIARFDTTARPDNWSVNFGSWEPADGVLVAREVEKDQHPAASRWRVPLADGVVTLKLRFAGAKAFHVGFDPAPGQLDKKGHLYSLILTPSQAQLMKHKDKQDAASQNQVLATASYQAVQDQWIDVELRTEGDRVAATIHVGANAVIKLTASDPTFHVAKPGVVFRVVGAAVHLDDVAVMVTKPSIVAQTAQ